MTNMTMGISSIGPLGEPIDVTKYLHWVGQTVPVRGAKRELLGEAEITDVFVRDDVLFVTLQTSLSLDYPGLRSVAEVITGERNGMSFQPMRDDPVARWLKAKRDDPSMYGNMDFYWGVDAMLDEYRTRADFGLSLEADITQLPDYGSGDDIARGGG